MIIIILTYNTNNIILTNFASQTSYVKSVYNTGYKYKEEILDKV